ncbi:MAG TPA: DUF565 domain-containing protein [Kamptonema sp.]|nr:DUF565 domain-containing protein [Kamptonema sp.]
MQNTRLNRLVDVLSAQLGGWLQNPWRRISLLIISLLFGFFLGGALSTIAGQAAEWDIFVAGMLVALTEFLNWIVYRVSQRVERSLWIDILNCLKIGLIYSLFVEAFKLGS